MLIATFVFNLYIFLINYLNYNSTRGTDFDKYGPYLDYYTFGLDSKLQEQGVGYFWFVSYFSKLKIDSLKISQNFETLVHNFGIHIANFIFYFLGCVGVYFLLKYLNIPYKTSLIAINFLAIFPPLLGARLILKPEIMGFAFVPWILLFIFKYYDEKKQIYLFFVAPFLALLISSKASISLMIGLMLLVFIKKELFNKFFIILTVFFLSLIFLLFYESYLINEKYLWQHVTPKGYDNVASLQFLFSINSELLTNPFRNSQATSMIGIILLDTFGDYWQRYWFHKDGWLGNLYPGSNLLNIAGVFVSIFFYSSLLYFLIKEQNKKLKKMGSLFLIGLGVLLINVFNVFPFLTKNFKPEKGDPIKTHYFAFFLALALVYLVIKLMSLKRNIFPSLILTIVFLLCIQIPRSASVEILKADQNTSNKIHLLSSCKFGDPISKVINYPDGWCNQDEISLSICAGEYNKEIVPKQENEFMIFPPDKTYTQRNLIEGLNTVTVSNYYECLNYANGGYILQSSEKYFFNEERTPPKAFVFTLLLSCIVIFYYIFFNKNKQSSEDLLFD